MQKISSVSKEVTAVSLIQVSNLTFAYEGSYDPIFENVSFQIDTNWRLRDKIRMVFIGFLLAMWISWRAHRAIGAIAHYVIILIIAKSFCFVKAF